MDRRKPILVNSYEVMTDKALQESVSPCQARVYPKVRLADALDIDRSGITGEEYSYALKAHFDFVVVSADGLPAFAVEFDGEHHDLDPKAIRRDILKGSICNKLGMPLLRIDATFLRRVGRFSVLGWLVEVWFLAQDWNAAQMRGEVPADECFHPSRILGLGYFDGSELVEVDADAYAKARQEMPAESFEAFDAKLRVFTPYDPFLPARALLDRLRERGICDYPPEVLQAADPQGYIVSVALLNLSAGGTVIGLGRCKPFNFPAIDELELSEELAVFQAAGKLKLFLKGNHKPDTVEQVTAWRDRIAKWKACL